MIIPIKDVFKAMFSPRLYKVYQDGPLENVYQPLFLEKWGDRVMTSAHTLLNITLYTSPLIVLYVYKRGFFTLDELKGLTPYIGGLTMFLAFSFMMKSFGRAMNPKYMAFLRDIEKKPNQSYDSYMTALRKYDFDFSAWPVSYEVSPMRTSWLPASPFSTNANNDLPFYKRATIQLLAFIATHTFALRLIYPGSMGFVYQLLWKPIIQGRANLVEMYDGERNRIKTAEGNYIDTMYVDNRCSNPNGRFLVVCCEGNMGFYEVGTVMSPLKCGYSVLGWNHPGFAESTGLPYLSQEHNAVLAVMEFAIKGLNFDPSRIVMFGWSIGGYSATWAAAHYPVRGLILDATFDDLIHLARKQMPASWSLLVKEVVRSYVNLNVSELLKSYDGPVHLMRRTEDEIICLTPGNNTTNRGNQLVIDLIQHRHPDMFECHREEVTRFANLLASKRCALEKTTKDAVAVKYVSEYMSDIHSTHCTLLPDEAFRAVMNQFLRRN